MGYLSINTLSSSSILLSAYPSATSSSADVILSLSSLRQSISFFNVTPSPLFLSLLHIKNNLVKQHFLHRNICFNAISTLNIFKPFCL